jgi:hypothetical protein
MRQRGRVESGQAVLRDHRVYQFAVGQLEAIVRYLFKPQADVLYWASRLRRTAGRGKGEQESRRVGGRSLLAARWAGHVCLCG